MTPPLQVHGEDVRLSLLFGLYHAVHNAPPHTVVCVGVHLLHTQSALLTCGIPPSGCCRRLAARRAASPGVSLACDGIRELVLLALMRPWGLQLRRLGGWKHEPWRRCGCSGRPCRNHDHHHGQLVSLHICACVYVCTYARIYYVYSSPDIAYICVYCQVIKI